MLSLGLTGGIAAGKSLLSARFRELGAVVIDADQLAREVVAPGTPGLAAVVEHFGSTILTSEGSLDRPRLGSVVFADPAARDSLNAIVHPLVRAAADVLKLDAGPGTIVVQDIPLLVESGQSANFHLVVVVQAPLEERIARMMRERGMSREDALARVAAQATDEERAAAADVLVLNDGSPEQAITELDALWQDRLLPFAANLAAGRPAAKTADVPRAAAQPGLVARTRVAAQARLAARIQRAVGERARGVEPVGAGQDLEFQLHPAVGSTHEHVILALAAAAFFPCTTPGRNLLASADPAQAATVDIVESQ